MQCVAAAAAAGYRVQSVAVRRRLFLLALWLGGTVAATSVVFVAVARLSTDLASVGKQGNVLTPGAGGAIPSTSTTSTALLVTVPATTVAATTTSVTATTTEVATTTATTVAAEPDVSEPRTATTVGRATPTAGPRTTAAGPGPATTPATPAPTPATTEPPPATTTPPPTQPPTTPPPSSCVPGVRRVGRAGSIVYSACPDGIRLVAVTADTKQWRYTLVSGGPPIVTVTFTSGSTTLSCTIFGDSEGGGTSGDC